MSDVSRLWRARLNARLAPLGLTHPLWRVPVHARGVPLAQTELAHRLGVEHPTRVQWLDRLEHEGWIRRGADPRDRRIRIVLLTSEPARWRRLETATSDLRREALSGFPRTRPRAWSSCWIARTFIRAPPQRAQPTNAG